MKMGWTVSAKDGSETAFCVMISRMSPPPHSEVESNFLSLDSGLGCDSHVTNRIWQKRFCHFFLSSPENTFSLVLEREGGRERERNIDVREKNTDVRNIDWLPLVHALTGIEPSTFQRMRRRANQQSHMGQGLYIF